MKKLVLILAVLNLVGCSAAPKQVAVPARRASRLPILATGAATTTAWPAYSFVATTASGIYSEPEPTELVITNGTNKIVTINMATAAVTYGKGVKPNEAAREFYAMVGKILKNNNCAPKSRARRQ